MPRERRNAFSGTSRQCPERIELFFIKSFEMKQITDIKEIQSIELGILEDIARFCDANGIRYTLSGGTLLGAIRHKGFIPWDDDADVAMLRPDYDRFVNEYHSDRYRLLSMETNTYPGVYAKVIDTRTRARERHSAKNIGVWVDVFPLDGAPRKGYCPLSTSFFWKRYRTIVKYRNYPLFSRRVSVRECLLSILGTLFRLVSNKRLISPLVRQMRRHSVIDSPFIGFIGGTGYATRETIQRTAFDDFIPVMLEGRIFSAMRGWHDYLSSLYGNYMIPPPPEKQKACHDFEAWWEQDPKETVDTAQSLGYK